MSTMLTLLVLCINLVTADVADIERMAVQRRRSIRSGEVIVRTLRNDSRARHVHIWWDGDSFRQDFVSGQHRKVDVWAGGRYLNWTDQLGDSGLKTFATVASVSDRGIIGSKQPNDPRHIGMAPGSFLNLVNYPLDEWLANPARTNTETATVDHRGIECTLVTVTRVNGAVVRAWIDPARDYAVLRLLVEIGEGEGYLSDSVDVEWAHFEPTGVWFPINYHYQRSAGERLKSAEEMSSGTIEVISLNKPIPPEVFTFEGIGVPVGWPVSDHTRPDVSSPLAWDGKGVVSVERATETAQVATRINLVYLFGAALLALVGAVLLWRFFSVRAAR